jgi:hypothetical protein
MNRTLVQRWLPFAVATGGALALWGLAVAHGYGWAMIWLPAAVAGAAWPRRGEGKLTDCSAGRVHRKIGVDSRAKPTLALLQGVDL